MVNTSDTSELSDIECSFPFGIAYSMDRSSRSSLGPTTQNILSQDDGGVFHSVTSDN